MLKIKVKLLTNISNMSCSKPDKQLHYVETRIVLDVSDRREAKGAFSRGQYNVLTKWGFIPVA